MGLVSKLHTKLLKSFLPTEGLSVHMTSLKIEMENAFFNWILMDQEQE
jgi:hypothetical protein